MGVSGSSNGEEPRGMEKEVQMSGLDLRSADEARRATEAIDEPICFNAKRGEREREQGTGNTKDPLAYAHVWRSDTPWW